MRIIDRIVKPNRQCHGDRFASEMSSRVKLMQTLFDMVKIMIMAMRRRVELCASLSAIIPISALDSVVSLVELEQRAMNRCWHVFVHRFAFSPLQPASAKGRLHPSGAGHGYFQCQF